MRVNRVVTGLDPDGRSTVVCSAPHENHAGSAEMRVQIVDLWRTDGPLADNASDEDTGLRSIALEPPPGGSVFRMVRFDPEDESASTYPRPNPKGAPPPSDPRIHVTNTTDYIVVIEGEVWAELEAEEVLLRKGDVLVQRGTVHAWRNRSRAPCLIAAVLVAAAPLNKS